MSTRRDFLKKTALGAAVTMLGTGQIKAMPLEVPAIHKNGRTGKMRLTFFPYELKLQHVFTVATYSRTTTPDVQVEIEYDGIVGYGEASMPPYLAKELGTVESVCEFLGRVQKVIGEFKDPTQLEDILLYIDKMDEGNAAGKALVAAGPKL